MFSCSSLFQAIWVSSSFWLLILRGRSFIQAYQFGNHDFCDDNVKEVEYSWISREVGGFLVLTFLWQQYFWNRSVSQQRRPLQEYGNWAIIDLGDIAEDISNNTTKSANKNTSRNHLYQHFAELFVKNGIHIILILKDTPNEKELGWIQKIALQHTSAKIQTFTRHELYNDDNSNGNKTQSSEMPSTCSNVGIDLLLGQFMTVGFLITTATKTAAANNNSNDSATVTEWLNHHDSSSMIRSVQRLFEFRSTGAFILLPSCHHGEQSSKLQNDFLVTKEQNQKMKKYGIDMLRISKDTMETATVTNSTLVDVALQQLGRTQTLSIRHFVAHWLWQFLPRK